MRATDSKEQHRKKLERKRRELERKNWSEARINQYLKDWGMFNVKSN